MLLDRAPFREVLDARYAGLRREWRKTQIIEREKILREDMGIGLLFPFQEGIFLEYGKLSRQDFFFFFQINFVGDRI